MNIKPKYHSLKTSVVLISLLISFQNSQGRYTWIICQGKLCKDRCLVLQNQFWSRCSLEQSFTVNKTAEATKMVFLICTVIALWPEEKKFPAVSSLKHTCIHTHTHIFVFWIRIKDPIEHCNIIYLQCKIRNLSENLTLYTMGFLHWLLKFADVWTFSLLTSTFSGLCLKWSQRTAGNHVLVSLNLENGQL